MKDDVRKLAADFKQFLSSREEDELIPAACSQAAASFVSKNQKQEDNHLTVAFVPPGKHPAHVKIPVQPLRADATPNTAVQDIPSPQPETEDMNAKEKQILLDQIAQEIHNCHRCPLGNTRLHAVPGEGNPAAKLMFIGEGPGFDEDHQGRPFIGRAGQLLDKMIAAMGLKREQVFIANIAKCHPMINPETPESRGNDRAPNAGEIAVCRKFLEQQIAAISPKYIVALGGVASKALISDTDSLGALRGKFHILHLDTVELKTPIKIIATFHPAALLRNPNWKKDAWADLQMVMKEMGLKRPQA